MKVVHTRDNIKSLENEITKVFAVAFNISPTFSASVDDIAHHVNVVRRSLFKMLQSLNAHITDRQSSLDFQRARIEFQMAKRGGLDFDAEQEQKSLPNAEAELIHTQTWHKAIKSLYEHFNDTLPLHEPQRFNKVVCSGGGTHTMFSNEVYERFPRHTNLRKQILIGLATFFGKPETLEEFASAIKGKVPAFNKADNAFADHFIEVIVGLQNMEAGTEALHSLIESRMPHLANALAQSPKFFARLALPNAVDAQLPEGQLAALKA